MTEPTVPPQVTPPATPPATPPKEEPKTPVTPAPTTPVTPNEEVVDDKEEPSVVKTEEETTEEIKTDDLDMLDPKNVAKVVDQTVNQRLGKLKESITDQRIKAELDAEIAAHPEYKPYEKRIRAWVNHANRKSFIAKGFPVKSVILESLAPYLERIGAAKAKAADAKAKATANGGQPTVPTTPKKVDVSKMDNKSIEQLANDVKNGKVKTF